MKFDTLTFLLPCFIFDSFSQTYRQLRDMTWAVERDVAVDLRQLPDIEDGQRLGWAVVSVCPGAGPPLCLYSAHPRHLVWHRATSSGLGPGLQQLQNIPTQSETIIRLRQVPSGEDLSIKVTGRTFVLSLCRSCMLYCLTHVFISVVTLCWDYYESTRFDTPPVNVN